MNAALSESEEDLNPRVIETPSTQPKWKTWSKRPSRSTFVLIIVLLQVFLAEVPRGIVLSTQPAYIEDKCINKLSLNDTSNSNSLFPTMNFAANSSTSTTKLSNSTTAQSPALGTLTTSSSNGSLNNASYFCDPQMTLGISVSMFSIGRLLANVPFGWIVDRTKSTRSTLLLANVISIAGTLLYAFAALFQNPRTFVALLVVSRFIIGFGSGTLSVTRAYMALISTPEQRTKAISLNTLLQYIGLSISPGIALGISQALKSSGTITSLTNTAYIPSAIVGSLCVIMLALLWTLPHLDPEPATSPKEDEDSVHSKDIENQNREVPSEEKLIIEIQSEEQPYKDSLSTKIPKIPDATILNEQLSEKQNWKTRLLSKELLAYSLFLFLNFSLRGALGVVETFGGKQYENIRLYDEDVQDDTSEFFTIIGVIGIVTFFIISPIEKRIGAFNELIIGIVAMIAGSVILLPTIMKNNLWLFSVGVAVIWSFGGPITQTLTISSYSQSMGSKPQGTKMGWLTTAGSLGRIVFPLLAGISFEYAHVVDIVLSSFSIVVILLFCFKFKIPILGFNRGKPHAF